MDGLASFVKEFLVPGSNWFLLVGTTLGLVFLFGGPSSRRLGRWWLTALTLAYWAFSIPAFAQWLATGSPTGATAKATAADKPQAVVALANGIHRFKAGELEINTLNEESVFTVLESVRLYRTIGSPLVIVSGGISRPEVYHGTEAEVFRDALLVHGVPAERVVLEQQSGTTREQAVNIGPILKARGITRFALVTSPVHMPRALAVFQSESLQPIPAPSAYGSNESRQVHSAWRPVAGAWTISQRAIYEDIGRLYYGARGWLPLRR